MQGKGRGESAEDERGGPEQHHEHGQADHQPDVDPADEADALEPDQAGDGVHHRDQHDGDRLHHQIIGNAPHRVQRAADLQAKEADRADGAGDHGDDRGGVGQGADRPLDRALAEQWIEQGAWCQGQTLVVVQVHQHDGQQAAQYRPGQEAPVHE
ncbi:hypothetical protein D3C76_1063990 [compost metagenome]